MDRTDLRILSLLQEDSSRSHADLAERVHLSSSQCSRRIHRLEMEGVIRTQVALLDEVSLGLNVEAYVRVTLSSYARNMVSDFHARIAAIPAIVDCCATTGDSDYLIRVLCTDLAAFSRLLNEDLLGHGDVASVQSSIVLNRVKHTTAIPLDFARAPRE
jgi:Lrp/AsnC family leucine-responsive transcriptional regulator